MTIHDLSAESEDRLLDGRVRIVQPVGGYRAAIDPVLLAAAVPARAGERVLDLGCGSGAAGLCLLARVPEVRVSGLEIQPRMADLACRGDAEGRRLQVVTGDLRNPSPEWVEGSFDHVMANPPYDPAGQGTRPPDGGKARAHVESDGDLGDWVSAALRWVRPRGSVTLIQRADRLAHLLALLEGRLGEMVVFPLWPMAGQAAKRVLVRGRSHRRTPLRLAAGLVLHRTDGSYTAEAERILRHGAPLEL
ncbi:methyltransferase [Magnetospira thiophila]